ncbi:MAG: HAMP domain-containing histidine kinase [Nocardioides sp.]|nr:HAMP domain-containing histidine kinase [Nocardioides sp.]
MYDETDFTAWSWRGFTLVVAIALAPSLALMFLRPASLGLADVGPAAGLITYPVVLVAAVLLYFHRRTSGHSATAWLTAMLFAIAIVGTTHSALLLTSSAQTGLARGWGLALHLGLCLLVLLAVLAAGRQAPRHDPVVMGLAAGVGMAGAFVAVPRLTGPILLPDVVTVLIGVAVVAAAAVTARVLLTLTGIEGWARRQLTVGVLLVSTAQTSAQLTDDLAVATFVLAALGTLGAAVLCATALALLRLSILETRREIEVLQEQLSSAVAEVRLDHERLHEIGSTIAGIASATQVIRHSLGISAERRSDLENMMEAELARLQRLMAKRAPVPHRAFSIDAVVETIVLSQRARGQRVDVTASGLRAVGQPDEIAEVVHVLLENAARHGGPGRVMIDVHEVGDEVEIAVSDTGPGVPHELTQRVFEWGARSPSSPGEGIGLNVARQLMITNGGSLELIVSSAPGATFVARLPIERVVHGVRTHVS